MSRLTRGEAVTRYEDGARPSEVVDYDWEIHYDEMMDTMPGLIGACLALDLPALTGPEIGSPLPIMVLNVPRFMPQIIIDPYLEQRKGPHVIVSALTYQGESMKINTSRISYANGEEVAEALSEAIATINKISR